MNAWEIDIDDWIDLKRLSEVYQVNGFEGRKVGMIALDTVEELRFSLTKGLSKK